MTVPSLQTVSIVLNSQIGSSAAWHSASEHGSLVHHGPHAPHAPPRSTDVYAGPWLVSVRSPGERAALLASSPPLETLSKNGCWNRCLRVPEVQNPGGPIHWLADQRGPEREQ